MPGVLRMLQLAHRRYGKLPWATLFEPAIKLAEDGFPISEKLYGELARDKLFPKDGAARAYFYQPDGTPKPAGTFLKNPELAATLEDDREPRAPTRSIAAPSPPTSSLRPSTPGSIPAT